jgi:ribosomal protein S11
VVDNLEFNLNEFLKNISIRKRYIQSLKKKTTALNNIKQKSYKLVNSTLIQNRQDYSLNDNIIMYIIDITFSRSNTFLHVMDASGKLKYYCSAGQLDYKGKNKKDHFEVFKSIYRILITKLEFLKNKPVALHLKNVGFKHFWILKKLKKKFFIKITRFFNLFPFNGCRKKKIRRKKIKKVN